MTNPIMIEVGAGELIDKITILEIKSYMIKDEEKLVYIRRELESLMNVKKQLPASEKLTELENSLNLINRAIWSEESGIRLLESESNFGPKFIHVARLVYKHNDRRAELKRQINDLVGSNIVEQKSYTRFKGESE